jgi:hypothetical protein
MDIAVKVLELTREAKDDYLHCKEEFISQATRGCPVHAIKDGRRVAVAQETYKTWHRLNAWAQREDESGDIRQWLTDAIEQVTSDLMRGTRDGMSTCPLSNAVVIFEQQARSDVLEVLNRIARRCDICDPSEK